MSLSHTGLHLLMSCVLLLLLCMFPFTVHGKEHDPSSFITAADSATTTTSSFQTSAGPSLSSSSATPCTQPHCVECEPQPQPTSSPADNNAGTRLCKECQQPYYYLSFGACYRTKDAGSHCLHDQQCSSGFCRGGQCCGNATFGHNCTECQVRSGVCDVCVTGAYPSDTGICVPTLSPGEFCTSNRSCRGNICTGQRCCANQVAHCSACSAEDGLCANCSKGRRFLNPITKTCGDIIGGMPCSRWYECESRHCGTGGYCCSSQRHKWTCLSCAQGSGLCNKCRDGYVLHESNTTTNSSNILKNHTETTTATPMCVARPFGSSCDGPQNCTNGNCVQGVCCSILYCTQCAPNGQTCLECDEGRNQPDADHPNWCWEPSPSYSSGSVGLSGGEIAGIVIGSVVGAGLIVAFLVWLICGCGLSPEEEAAERRKMLLATFLLAKQEELKARKKKESNNGEEQQQQNNEGGGSPREMERTVATRPRSSRGGGGGPSQQDQDHLNTLIINNNNNNNMLLCDTSIF